MNLQKYKTEIYDVNGNFIVEMDVDVPSIARSINSIDSAITVKLPNDFEETPDVIQAGYEFRIYDNHWLIPVYSGFVLKPIKKADSDSQVSVMLTPFAGALERTRLTGNGNRLSFVRDGTYSADTGSLDSKKSSDLAKLIIAVHRFKNGSVDQSYIDGGDTNINFGGVNRVTQSFTAAQNHIVGVKLRLKYNSGTSAVLDVSIRADDGTGKPTGANLAVARIVSLSNTSYNWVDAYFDTPLALSVGTVYHIYVASSGSGSGTLAWHADLSASTYAGGSRTYSTDSGGTWTVYAGDQLFQTIYVSDARVRLNYTSGSIDASADSKTYTFTDLSGLGALNYVQRYSPSDFNYYIDATNTLHFHRTGTSSSLLLHAMDSITSWTNGGGIGTIALNTSIKVEGSASVGITLDGTTTDHLFYRNVLNPNVSSYRNVGPWLYIPVGSTVQSVRVRLYSNSQTNYSEWAVPRNVLKVGGWNWLMAYIDMGSTPIASSGTLDKTAVDRIAVRIITRSSAEALTYYVDNFLAGNVEATDAVYKGNVIDMEFEETIEDLCNRVYVTNNASILRVYEDTVSQAAYGMYEKSIIDERLSVTATFDEIGNAFIAKNSKPKKKLTKLVLDGTVDVGRMRPGYLIWLRNMPVDFGLEDFYAITRVVIYSNRYELEVEEVSREGEKVSSTEQRLELLEKSAVPTGQAAIQ